MRFSESLKKNHDFRRIYSRGKSAASPLLVVYCRRSGGGVNRLGLTVGTKLGKAVHRNRIKRRLREIYRLNEPRLRRGYDIVVVARVKSRYSSFQELEADMLELFKKLGLIPEEKQQ